MQITYYLTPLLTYQPGDEAQADHGDDLGCEERHFDWTGPVQSESGEKLEVVTAPLVHRPLLRRHFLEIPDFFLAGRWWWWW